MMKAALHLDPRSALVGILAAVVLALGLATPGPARAGEYTISICQADEAGYVSSAFEQFATRGMKWRRACDPRGDGLRGLVTANVPDGGRVEKGAQSGFILNAPPGTSFSRFRWSGEARRRDCRYALQLFADSPGGSAISMKNVRANRGCPRPGMAQASGAPFPRAYDLGGATRIVQRVVCMGSAKHQFCSARGRNYIRTFDSNLKDITFPAGTGNVDEYEFDQASRMSKATFSKSMETLASLSYTRDKIGQVEEEANTGLPGSEEITYGYDESERLVEAGEGSFEYDDADNLTKALGTTNAYDAASQLETGTGVSYTYDKLGQRVETAPASGPATTYDYDQAGNLISIDRPEEGETPAIEETFAYDGSGLLASQFNGLTTQYLTWDLSASEPLLLNDDQNSYIYGPNGLPITQISSEETPIYLHHDQLGSTRMLTDSSGEVTGTFSFSPYGTPEGSTGTATTPMGFAGQYTDSQSGLQYLRARFYDPSTGQFMTRDPLAAIMRTSYGYANQSPLHYVDPSGMSCVGVGHAGPVSYPTLDPVDCATEAITGAPGAAADAGGLVLDLGSSAVLPVLLSIACIAEPDWCPALFAGGVGATVGSNAAKEATDPCFNVVSETLNDLLVAAAAALPGGVFGVTAGRSGPQLGPVARRIIEIVLNAPGLALEIVRSTGR
jgi:RHS repeat-associated protein